MELLKTHQKKDEKVRYKIQENVFFKKENVLKTTLPYSMSVYFNKKNASRIPWKLNGK